MKKRKFREMKTGEKNEKGNEIILYLFRQCCIFGIFKEKKNYLRGPCTLSVHVDGFC